MRIRSNIAINDLKVKIQKAKVEVAKGDCQRLVIEISALASQLDAANSLLLNIKKMVDGLLIYPQKSEVKKLNEEDEIGKELSEADVLEALEEPEEIKAEPVKKYGKSPVNKLIVRQEFTVPPGAPSEIAPKEIAKIEKNALKLDLTEDEIIEFVNREFLKITSRTNEKIEIIPVENYLLPILEEDTPIDEDEEFVDLFGDNKKELVLSEAFTKRLIQKIEDAKNRSNKTLKSKKELNKKKKFKPSKDILLLNADFARFSEGKAQKDGGVLLPSEMTNREEKIIDMDQETKDRLMAQKLIIKKL